MTTGEREEERADEAIERSADAPTDPADEADGRLSAELVRARHSGDGAAQGGGGPAPSEGGSGEDVSFDAPPPSGALRRARRVGRRARGAPGVLRRHVADERHHVHRRPAPLAGSQEPDGRAAREEHADVRRERRRRRRGAPERGLPDPPEEEHGARRRPVAPVRPGRRRQREPADRLLLPLPRRERARALGRDRAVGHRQRRQPRHPGDQGGGRSGARPGAGHGQVRRHALERRAHGPRRSGARSRPARRVPRELRPPPDRRRRGELDQEESRERRGDAPADLRAPPEAERHRVRLLQACHRRPAYRATHGRAPGERARRLPRASRAHRAGGRDARPRAPDQRDPLLP